MYVALKVLPHMRSSCIVLYNDASITPSSRLETLKLTGNLCELSPVPREPRSFNVAELPIRLSRLFFHCCQEVGPIVGGKLSRNWYSSSVLM